MLTTGVLMSDTKDIFNLLPFQLLSNITLLDVSP
jgi:hypothetical protein